MAKKSAKTEIDVKAYKKDRITVRGASLHNLKNISVEIPHKKFTVISGISGSGKSTLAFDTIYAEGQRRFVESLSAYARQFLERMEKPDVEVISGLPPAVAIEQRKQAKNPRSTVGTTTEIYDYLRLMFGRIGKTYCRNCGKPVRKDTAESVVTEIKKMPASSKLFILIPLSKQTRNIQTEVNKFREHGFFRYVLKDGNTVYDFDDADPYKNSLPDEVFILVDRLVTAADEETYTRISDSLEQAFRSGDGRIKIRDFTQKTEYNFSSIFECSDCEIVYREPEPRLFSFNNPYGACHVCQGFGRSIGIDEDLVVPDKSKSLRKQAILPFRTPRFTEYQLSLLKEAESKGVRQDVPYSKLSQEEIDFVWDGNDEYQGINGFFRMLEDNNYKMHYRILLSRYRGFTRCKSCNGSRIRTSARQVYIYGENIPGLVAMPVSLVLDFMKNLKLNDYEKMVVGQVVKELIWRLQLLVDIGLHYLTLDRLSHTLSGGEAQRINLSSALGSSLVGTLYVLDEPSIGMHPRDTGRLLEILFKLKNLGNTIIVVEHDPDIIKEADYLIDMGPKAGENGGEVVYAGDIKGVLGSKKSITGQYLSGNKRIEFSQKRNKGNGHALEIINPRKHNLRMEKVVLPLGCMIAVTGVSGSGKSTLIHDIIYEGLRKAFLGGGEETGLFEKISGTVWLDNVEMIDQSSIGKTTRSTPITYTKVFDSIRDLFASTQAAKQLGWKAGHFSFNVPGGRCEECEGEGTVTVDMQFLPDIQLPCESCRGTRYKREARSILFKGKSIVDILNMTIDEALEFFADIPKICRKLQILTDVGLGYLRLGQPSSMLSGGEAQRIKLASHLDSDYKSNLMFIFDEPTTGLHLDDISKLINCFKRLIESGHSVVIIEHNLHVIASCDHVIDLGPDAGFEGGLIVATGTPEQLANTDTFTGKALNDFLESKGMTKI